jgi:hypothetical protein
MAAKEPATRMAMRAMRAMVVFFVMGLLPLNQLLR